MTYRLECGFDVCSDPQTGQNHINSLSLGHGLDDPESVYTALTKTIAIDNPNSAVTVLTRGAFADIANATGGALCEAPSAADTVTCLLGRVAGSLPRA
jgi:hypothetical protein